MGQSRGRADREGSGLARIEAVDYHTAGEPFRIVTGGVPPLEGRTILDKRRFAAEQLDDVRNYDGSWTEWGNLVDVPIEKGTPA